MIAKISKNKFLSSIIIAVAASILLSLLFQANVFQEWNYGLSDALYSEKKPLDDIVIVAIDDKSLQEIGRWPWPREVYVNTLPKFNESRVVGIDVAFFEPYDKNADLNLGNEISKLNAVIPVEFVSYEVKNGRLYAIQMLKPIPEIENKSDVGFINIITDNDGVTRNSYLTIEADKNYSSFHLKVVQKYLGKNISFDFNSLIINFVGKPKSFRTVPFSDVYNNKTEIDFAGK